MLDVAIIGGGLSGSLAAAVLGRAGYRVGLVDRHTVYPPDFRAEHIHEEQADTLRRLGLLEALTAGVPCVRQVAFGRRGRIVGVWPTVNYGMRYDAIVNAARRLLPPQVEVMVGRVADVEAGPELQRVQLVDGRLISARLLIVATGLGYAMCKRLGVTRVMLHKGHSLTFGFDIVPGDASGFRFPFIVYQGERIADGIDYLAAFDMGDTMRANMFTFRDHRDPWVHDMATTPRDMLVKALPGLDRLLGPFRVPGPVQARATDLYTSDNVRRPGFVLIGDAFQTACPPAGEGMTRAVTDVERLCAVHVPQWLATPGMGVEKIAAFYDDPVKRAADAHALHSAHYRRALTTEMGLTWSLHRGRVVCQAAARGLMHRVRLGLMPQAA